MQRMDVKKNRTGRYPGFIKFAASSLVSFAADYGMYSLLVLLTGGLNALSVPLSNVVARILSAALNFTINKHFVFRDRDRTLSAGLKYAMLAACVLAGNTVLLSILVHCLGMNRFVAKLLTEILLFLISWFMQKAFVFKTSAPCLGSMLGKDTGRVNRNGGGK